MTKKESKSNLDKDITKYYLQISSFFLIISVLLFVTAGRIDWFWAWIYLIMFPVYTTINALILPKELIAERSKSKDNVKNWDKVLTRIGIIPALGVIIITGLDKRFGWSHELSLNVHIIGLTFYMLGNIIVSWSMASNKYFSAFVRIQVDREHEVATTGPYKFVRHPGYVGIMLNSLFTPLILGSLWALIPAFLLALLYVIRTAFEDSTLQRELEGYKVYSNNVRYRLVYGIW